MCSLPNFSIPGHTAFRQTPSQSHKTMSTEMADQTSINFGQIFAVAVIGYLVFRWFTSPNSLSTQSSSRNAGRQVNPAHVEQVAQMFPQLDRRNIMWDLQRNGGSVQATTERILMGRGLDNVRHCSFTPIMTRPCSDGTCVILRRELTLYSHLHLSNLKYHVRQPLQAHQPQLK